MNYFIEPIRKTEVYGKYDVVVCGGGVAGIAAALAAARNGAKTVLLESLYMLGGLATAGVVTNYLPLCDGKGHQIAFGIVEELLKLSIKHGYDKEYPKFWIEGGTVEQKSQKRYNVYFNPNVFAIVAGQLLQENGVEIIYGANVVGGIKEKSGDKLAAALIETRGGRYAIVGKSFIDCTGDAALYHFIGEKTDKTIKGNTLAWWFYELKDGEMMVRERGSRDIDSASGKSKNGFMGIDAKELTDKTLKVHDNLLNDFLENGEESLKHTLAIIPTIPDVRMTRKVIGEYSLDRAEKGKFFCDSVGTFPDWIRKGPCYELPFGCLWSSSVKNLGVAGRCISVTEEMWELTRVIPVCAVSGEAIGTAAAMTDDFSTLDVKELQDRLTKNGVVLHLSDLGVEGI